MGKYAPIDYYSGSAKAMASYHFFESNDCTGPAYVGAGTSHYIYLNGYSLYSGDSIAPMPINYNSQLSSDGLTCKQRSGTMYLVPAIEVDLPFDMPVALPLNFQHEPAHPGKWNK